MNKLGIIVLGVTLAASAAAQTQTSITVPGGNKQQALCANIDAEGVHASLCQRGGVAAPASETLALPAAARANVKAAELRAVDLGSNRRALHVSVPLAEGSSFEALIAAPVGAGPAPKVLWSGSTGLTQGEPGERKGAAVVVRDHSVLVGDRHENIDICGRPTLLSARAVVPTDLSLRPVKVQQLSAEERKAAPRLRAVRDEAPISPGGALYALAASSATGAPQALTDGDAKTFWAENRGGDGRGEFIVARAPKQLGLKAFHLLIHPYVAADSQVAAPASGSAPRELWLVTDDQVFNVQLAEDAWRPDAPAFRVDLPNSVHTSCVALVLEKGYQDKKDTQVAISELWADSDVGSNWPEVVAQLDAEGDSARSAAAALGFGGPEALSATAAAYPSLSPRAQLLALEVLDEAPCELAAPAYWSALQATAPAEAGQAERRVERCRTEVAALLLQQLQQADKKARPDLIQQLAQIAPEIVAKQAPDWLAGASTRERHALRAALQVTADAPAAEGVLRSALAQASLPAKVQLDLLRALAFRSTRFSPEYSEAFRRQSQKSSDFATQYLLLAPAASLADTNEFARKQLRQRLTRGERPELRAEAAQHADVKLFQRELLAATRDSEVRVRLSAVESLADDNAIVVGKALLERLQDDDWPMVRAAAARSLVGQRGKEVDAALAEALSDESRHVRRPAALVLGKRGARLQAPLLRERVLDDEEDHAVRAAAALALGQLCDTTLLDEFTDYAMKLRSLPITEGELWLAQGSLRALGALSPADLKHRLTPLLAKDVPAPARRLARQTLQQPRSCAAAAKAKGAR